MDRILSLAACVLYSFSYAESHPEAPMCTHCSLLRQDIARLRRDVRIQTGHLQNLVDAELDCTIAAKMVMHTQSDLREQLEQLEHVCE